MLFFGFFWAFFHSALCPSIEIGGVLTSCRFGGHTNVWFPLFNTFILIISGFSVTWVHRGIALGLFKDSIDGFIITISLGLLFILLQGIEYYESTFNLEDGIYPSVFFLLTGLHGCHVIVGVFFYLFVLFLYYLIIF